MLVLHSPNTRVVTVSLGHQIQTLISNCRVSIIHDLKQNKNDANLFTRVPVMQVTFPLCERVFFQSKRSSWLGGGGEVEPTKGASRTGGATITTSTTDLLIVFF